MRSLNSKKGISRLRDAWYLNFHGRTELFKDEDHGGDPRRALAAAIVQRFKWDLAQLADKFDWDSNLNLHSRKGTERSVVTGVWREGDAYKVSINNYDPQMQGKAATFTFENYGEQTALWLAVYIRHIYNYFFYSETYQQNRNSEEFNLPKDELLDELGIPRELDMKTLRELRPEISPEMSNPKSGTDGAEASEKVTPQLTTVSYDKDTYEDWDFPRVQGVSWSPAAGTFYGSVPGNSKKGFKDSDDMKSAYKRAVMYRHYTMQKVFGERYDKLRNKPDNFHPSDKLLEDLGIPKTEPQEATLFDANDQ